jgi:hypothetical protein
MILQPRVAVVTLLFLLSYLLLPSPSQQDPQKSLQTPAVKSYSNQKVLYSREVKDTDNAEVDTKIVTDKAEKVSINYKLHLVNEEWKSTTSHHERKNSRRTK